MPEIRELLMAMASARVDEVELLEGLHDVAAAV
jgi:hypothetical protein